MCLLHITNTHIYLLGTSRWMIHYVKNCVLTHMHTHTGTHTHTRAHTHTHTHTRTHTHTQTHTQVPESYFDGLRGSSCRQSDRRDVVASPSTAGAAAAAAPAVAPAAHSGAGTHRKSPAVARPVSRPASQRPAAAKRTKANKQPCRRRACSSYDSGEGERRRGRRGGVYCRCRFL